MVTLYPWDSVVWVVFFFFGKPNLLLAQGSPVGTVCQPVVSGVCHPVTALPWLNRNKLRVLEQAGRFLLVVSSFSQKNWIEHQLIFLSQEVATRP